VSEHHKLRQLDKTSSTKYCRSQSAVTVRATWPMLLQPNAQCWVMRQDAAATRTCSDSTIS